MRKFDDFEKVKVLVSKKDPEDKDRTITEFQEVFLNPDVVSCVKKDVDDKWTVELLSGKVLVAKDLTLD